MSTAPWWATGAFTLAGVVMAQLVTFVLNRSRERFEDSRRWHEDRRDIYLDVVAYAWKIENAVYNHFERDRPLLSDLNNMLTELGTAKMKAQLVGSEEVTEVAQRLTVEASTAVVHAQTGTSGNALDACDNIRHTLYYLTDLMRSELTSSKVAVSKWHRKRPKRRQSKTV
jgi:hypothetical protein